MALETPTEQGEGSEGASSARVQATPTEPVRTEAMVAALMKQHMDPYYLLEVEYKQKSRKLRRYMSYCRFRAKRVGSSMRRQRWQQRLDDTQRDLKELDMFLIRQHRLG